MYIYISIMCYKLEYGMCVCVILFFEIYRPNIHIRVLKLNACAERKNGPEVKKGDYKSQKSQCCSRLHY